MTPEERFWSKVDKSGDCWEWTARRTEKGYGQFKFKGRTSRANRVAYELSHGPIPNGLHVCHTCDNPPCCNPAHLFLGTVGDNTRDSVKKGRYWTWKHPEKRAVGSRNGHAKLNEETVRHLRAAVADGRSIADLARMLRVYPSTVLNAVTGKTWKHVL